MLSLSIARAWKTSKSDFFTLTRLFLEPIPLSMMRWNPENLYWVKLRTKPSLVVYTCSCVQYDYVPHQGRASTPHQHKICTGALLLEDLWSLQSHHDCKKVVKHIMGNCRICCRQPTQDMPGNQNSFLGNHGTMYYIQSNLQLYPQQILNLTYFFFLLAFIFLFPSNFNYMAYNWVQLILWPIW